MGNHRVNKPLIVIILFRRGRPFPPFPAGHSDGLVNQKRGRRGGSSYGRQD